MKRVMDSQEASMSIHRASVSELTLIGRESLEMVLQALPAMEIGFGCHDTEIYADSPRESRSWAKLLRTVRLPISVASVGEPWHFELHSMLSLCKQTRDLLQCHVVAAKYPRTLAKPVRA